MHLRVGITTNNGPTRDQILGFLKTSSIEEINSFSSKIATHVFADGGPLGGPHLSTANGVWNYQSLRIKSAFKEIIKSSYKAASNHVDFQTKEDEFDASMTKDHKFFLLNGSSIQVPFMTSTNNQYISEFGAFKVPFMTSYEDAKDHGLPALLEKFGSESRFIKNHVQQSLVEVGEFRIPKFKISFNFEAWG
ncbi:hypothetical protein MIMGU_mgv1a017884mg, partial [Erythranthe guttata]